MLFIFDNVTCLLSERTNCTCIPHSMSGTVGFYILLSESYIGYTLYKYKYCFSILYKCQACYARCCVILFIYLLCYVIMNVQLVTKRKLFFSTGKWRGTDVVAGAQSRLQCIL